MFWNAKKRRSAAATAEIAAISPRSRGRIAQCAAALISERVMRTDLSTNIGLITLFNVYLPTDYRDLESLDNFCMCLGQVSSLVDTALATSPFVGISGNFNANIIGSIFFTELQEFADDKGMVISDFLLLGDNVNTYTFVSAAHSSTSWLDHFICSQALHSVVSDIAVRYDMSVFDHMPLIVDLAVAPATCNVAKSCSSRRARLKWEIVTAGEI